MSESNNRARRVRAKVDDKYGKLTIKKIWVDNHVTYCRCDCDCGNVKEKVRYSLLRSGHTSSCGCIRFTLDKIIGARFERLLVLSRADRMDGRGDYYFKCVCDCGNITYAIASNLLSGNAKSCGCFGSDVRKRIIKKVGAEYNDANIIDGTSIAMIKANKPQANNKSGYRGVSFSAAQQKYIAKIYFKGVMYFLGYYKDPKLASEAYQKAKKELHGKFLDDLRETK